MLQAAAAQFGASGEARMMAVGGGRWRYGLRGTRVVTGALEPAERVDRRNLRFVRAIKNGGQAPVSDWAVPDLFKAQMA